MIATLPAIRIDELDALPDGPWKDYAKRLQRYLRKLDALLWPDLFIIGGGVSKEASKFLSEVKVRTPITTAQLLNNAGIVGAAVLAEAT